MGCAIGLVKGVMATFNFLFVLVGIALISLGTYIFLDIHNYDEMVSKLPAVQVAPTLVIILGVIIFLIAFFGCCGVIRESHCMLTTYAVMLLIIFFIQLGIGVYTYLQVDKTGEIEPVIKEAMQTVFDKYNEEKDAKEAIDFVQKQFHCCGVNGPNDYNNVPASCCKDMNGVSCNTEILSIKVTIPFTYYNTGCAHKVTQVLNDKIEIVFYVCIGVAVVEILGALFAFCLASSVKNESRRRYA